MNKRGVVTLLMVFVVSVLAVFITSVWQIRYLYSLNRGKTLSEALTLGYHAEFRLYDVIARFLGGYSTAFVFPFNTTETLSDGSVLTMQGDEVGSEQVLIITSKKQFASTKMQMRRVVSEAATGVSKPTEIMLSLDCTSSMGDHACDGCSSTRMDEQKKAVNNFLDLVRTSPAADEIKVGISVFAMNGEWLYTSYSSDGTPTGTPITPDSELTVDQIKQAVTTNFGHTGEGGSLACRKVNRFTSVGTGLAFMHDYFKTVTEDKNMIEVLITDGEPNERIPYTGCPQNNFCPGDEVYCCPGGSMCYITQPWTADGSGWTCPYGAGSWESGPCLPHARDFLRCALATTESPWTSEVNSAVYPGVRDPEVDAYMVTVLDTPPENVTSILETFATRYYNSASASDLSAILSDIFGEILTSTTHYSFSKVTPTPVH